MEVPTKGFTDTEQDVALAWPIYDKPLFFITNDTRPANEEFQRKTRYIHFGQFEIFEI